MEILKRRSDVVSFMFYEILPFMDFQLLFYKKEKEKKVTCLSTSVFLPTSELTYQNDNGRC